MKLSTGVLSKRLGPLRAMMREEALSGLGFTQLPGTLLGIFCGARSDVRRSHWNTTHHGTQSKMMSLLSIREKTRHSVT